MYSLPPNADAAALVDDNPELVDWSQRDHCTIYCKNGHCHSLVKASLLGVVLLPPIVKRPPARSVRALAAVVQN